MGGTVSRPVAAPPDEAAAQAAEVGHAGEEAGEQGGAGASRQEQQQQQHRLHLLNESKGTSWNLNAEIHLEIVQYT